MLRYAIAGMLMGLATVRAEDPRGLFPASIRLVAVWNRAGLVETPAYKAELTIRGWNSDFDRWCTTFGIDPTKQIRRAWLACGENYPLNSLLIVEGQFDVKAIADKWKDLVKNNRWNAKAFNERGLAFHSIEIPAAVNPVPGFPALVFFAVLAPDTVVVTFDKNDLLAVHAATKAPANPLESVELHAELDKLDARAAFAMVALPPASLTTPSSMLHGVKSIVGSLRFTDGLSLQFVCNTTDAGSGQAVAERTRSALTQVRQLFPALAGQQGLDSRLVKFVVDLAGAAKVEAKGETVEIGATLNAAELAATLKR